MVHLPFYLFVLFFLRLSRNTAAPTAASTAAITMINAVGIMYKLDHFGGCGFSDSESVKVSSPSGRPGRVSASPPSVFVKPSIPLYVM